MKDKILQLLIVLFIFPALASAAPKEEKVFANYFIFQKKRIVKIGH